ncbi:MAG: VCBS repeat-containing protein [Ignavibacteriota bacterium]
MVTSVTILLGKGDGTFQTFVSYPAPTGAYSVASEDFNGDSKPDLAITSYSGSVTILSGEGERHFPTSSDRSGAW